jgi:hypothetical protein
MIAGERASVGLLTEQPIRYFKQSLLLSVLLHGLIAVFLVNRENLGNRVRVVPAQTVRVYLQQASPAPTKSKAQVENDNAVEPEALKQVSTALQEKSAKKVTAEIKSPSASSAVISALGVKSLPANGKVSAINQFLELVVLDCNPIEKLSEIRNCDDSESEPLARPKPRRFERDLARLFKPSETVTSKFKQDMERVKKLTYELEHLNAVISASDDNPDLLLQRQRELQKDIQRINTQYDDLNLLEVLGSGIKTLKKGYETVRDKK